jgi:hypothetical protein
LAKTSFLGLALSEDMKALIFGLGGLASGVISARVFMQEGAAAEYGAAHPTAFLLLVVPGVIFVTSAGFCFAICHANTVPSIQPTPWRLFSTALLVASNTLFATLTGLLAGIATAGLMASPAQTHDFGAYHPQQHTHSLLFSSLPAMVGLAFGAIVAAVLVSLALYIFTRTWDPTLWAILMFGSAIILIATVVMNPRFLEMWHEPQEDSNPIFLRTFSTLLILGYPFYGLVAGYWIARSATPAVASGEKEASHPFSFS